PRVAALAAAAQPHRHLPADQPVRLRRRRRHGRAVAGQRPARAERRALALPVGLGRRIAAAGLWHLPSAPGLTFWRETNDEQSVPYRRPGAARDAPGIRAGRLWRQARSPAIARPGGFP